MSLQEVEDGRRGRGFLHVALPQGHHFVVALLRRAFGPGFEDVVDVLLEHFCFGMCFSIVRPVDLFDVLLHILQGVEACPEPVEGMHSWCTALGKTRAMRGP